MTKLLLQPNTLWQSLKKTTKSAIACGALQPIPTECEVINGADIPFLVRIVSNLARKDKEKKKQEQKRAQTGADFNPFLPYDEALFVSDISDTHLCLLNKYNVMDYHLLIVTRAFEEQDNLLTLQDFTAVWATLAQIDGLAFYNAGKIAGASQRHKHLQLVPLPLAPNQPQIPIEPLLGKVCGEHLVEMVPDFPFVHAIAKLDPHWSFDPENAGKQTLDRYHRLLDAVGLSRESGNAYNLLLTKEWMMIVPRSAEEYQSISVNSLGFAGALLVRNQQQLELVKDYGGMNILKSVAIAR